MNSKWRMKHDIKKETHTKAFETLSVCFRGWCIFIVHVAWGFLYGIYFDVLVRWFSLIPSERLSVWENNNKYFLKFNIRKKYWIMLLGPVLQWSHINPDHCLLAIYLLAWIRVCIYTFTQWCGNPYFNYRRAWWR